MAGAQEEKVTLYGVWSSPFSKRVELALRMKGIEYEYLEQDLANKSSDLLKYNPVHKKIPILVHGEKSISESMVIIEYIDESWKSGPAILPVDPYERAMARFWVDFIFRKCMEPIWMAIWTSDEKEYEKRAEEAIQNFKILEEQLIDGKKFFGGESPGYVDIIAGFIAVWLGAIQEASGKKIVKEGKDGDYPLLFKWKERFLSWSVAKETLPAKDKLAAHFRAMYEASRVAKDSSVSAVSKS